MEEDVWDFYFCRIDDEPGSIFFNESVRNRAPVAGFNKLVVLSLRMQAPRDDGLSSNDEFEVLRSIEELLETTLAPPDVCYVGRATHDGLRDFYFYTPDADRVIAAADAAMTNFPHYEYATPVEQDADWRIYLEFLYPSPRDRQHIENRKVCESLESHGDRLDAKREIAHWAYFPNAKARDEFIEKTASLGFRLRGRVEPHDGVEFGAHIFREDLASWNAINEVTLELFELAAELGGEYDGWESPVIKVTN